MPRADLLALSEDDLASLANRGLVKRALRDLESGLGPVELEEEAGGTVRAAWPDGSAVRLATNVKVGDGCCTCPATTICRHIVGTILSYQRKAPDAATGPPKLEPWNPGTIADSVIAPLYKPTVMEAIRKEWQSEVVIEVHKLAKPFARLHSTGHTVRFLVPNDLRYVQCDCAEEAPCRHVPLAIWAFRELGEDRKSALLALHQRAKAEERYPAEIDSLVAGMCEFGMAELPPTHLRRWETLQQSFTKDRIPWPAEIVSEILQARERQRQGDARFSPSDLAALAGELLIRGSAMRSDNGAVPQLFVRGSPKDVRVEIGTARLVGLGSFVDVKRKSVTLNIPLQDTSTGLVVSVRKDSQGMEPFDRLAASHFNKQYRYDAIAAGQILAKGAKRSPNLELMASRAPLIVHPQAFEWEKLRPPVLVEDFAEILAHQSVLPPASLRPRRMNEDLYVCPVERVSAVAFDAVEQQMVARLEDASGGEATLQHPYHSRAAAGFARLRKHLGVTRLKFAAGRVRMSARGLLIEPCGLVFEENGARWLLQPWTDSDHGGAVEVPSGAGVATGDPVRQYLGELQAALGDILTAGFERGDSQMVRRWQDLQELGERLGFARLLDPVRELHKELERRPAQVEWSAERACAAALSVLACLRFGIDLA